MESDPAPEPAASERRGFYPMLRGDVVFLAVLIVFSVVSFLPWSRTYSAGGMALLGWMMAALMVLSPAIALVRILRDRGRVRIPRDGGRARR